MSRRRKMWLTSGIRRVRAWWRRKDFDTLFGFPVVLPETFEHIAFVRKVDAILFEDAQRFLKVSARANEFRKRIRELPTDQAIYAQASALFGVTERAKCVFWERYDFARRAGVPVRWHALVPDQSERIVIACEEYMRSAARFDAYQSSVKAYKEQRPEQLEEAYAWSIPALSSPLATDED